MSKPSKGSAILEQIGLQLGAIAAAFLLGFFLVLAFGFDPFEVYGVLLSGALGSVENVAWTLQNTTPLIFTGLAVALAFRAGLFNIGAEGQLVAGAFAAGVVGWVVPAVAAGDATRLPFWRDVWYPIGGWTLGLGVVVFVAWLVWDSLQDVPSERSLIGSITAGLMGFLLAALVLIVVPEASNGIFGVANRLLIPVTLLASALAGAAWAYIPAILRAKLGVSEVINTIMFNFIATYLASWLLTTATFKAPGAVPQTPPVAPAARLASMASVAPDLLRQDLAATRLNLGFFLALVLAAWVAYLLWRTVTGFELRAVGLNPEAAAAQGISTQRNVVLALCLSGALAGLGGAEQVLGVHHTFVKDFWVGLGFTGIAVALVGQNHPVGVVLAALLFGALQNGAVEIDMMTLFPRELILVLQALIIFLVTSGPVIKELLLRRRA